MAHGTSVTAARGTRFVRSPTTDGQYAPDAPPRVAASTHAMSTVGVLFDFDGTLGDTESPAMDVAFWELAPYIPSLGGVAEDGAARAPRRRRPSPATRCRRACRRSRIDAARCP